MIYRIENKEIMEYNLAILKILVEILKQIVKGEKIKKAYLSRYEAFETEATFMINRKCLMYYMRDLQSNNETA